MEGRGGGDHDPEGGGEPSGISSCPSFNSYSSALPVEGGGRDRQAKELEHVDDDDDDFEFVPAIGDDGDGFVISSGRIGPVYPVFNRDLLLDGTHGWGSDQSCSITIPLRDLFMEEERHRRSSSSETDELDGIPEGSYCVWTPRGREEAQSRCKKSNSTGSRSSRRWRFLDRVVRRSSSSDRKDSLVLLTPSEPHRREGGEGGKSVGYGRKKVVVAVMEGADKSSSGRRRTWSYRKDAVGFLANVNGLRKKLPVVGDRKQEGRSV